MITIITNKKLAAQLESAAQSGYEVGKDAGAREVAENVINTLLDMYDGSKHVFLHGIAPVISILATMEVIDMQEGMNITEICATRCREENEMASGKKSKSRKTKKTK